jgi:hypothetical protein
VRQQLSLFYDLPRVPLLHFVRDTVEERASRVDDLLLNLERDRLAREGAKLATSKKEMRRRKLFKGHARFNH